MKGRLLFLALALPICGLAQDDKPGGEWDARISAVQGDVRLFPAEGPGGAQGIAAESGTPLSAGDRLKTGPNSRVEIAFDGDSIMDIGPGSEFALSSLSRRSSMFSLNLGSLIAKVKKLLGSDRMEVASPTAVASVRGTEFGVDVSPEGHTQVGVFNEGQVAVSSRENSSLPEMLLKRNQETELRRGAATAPVARPLTYFRAQRERIRRLRVRLPILRRQWVPRPSDQRGDLRRKFLQRGSNRPPDSQEDQPERRRRPAQEDGHRRSAPRGR